MQANKSLIVSHIPKWLPPENAQEPRQDRKSQSAGWALLDPALQGEWTGRALWLEDKEGVQIAFGLLQKLKYGSIILSSTIPHQKRK